MFLQEMRFGSRITYQVDCQVDARQVSIPTFTFQPLVENAIIHGLAPKEEGGKILIRIKRQKDMLCILVADNGNGLSRLELRELKQKLRKEETGAENNWPSYEAMQHYEVAGYFTVDEHVRIPEIQICAKHTWDQLSAEDQQIIRACAKESAGYERRLWKERERAARETALNNQVQEILLSEDERKKFQKAMEPLYDKYSQDYGEDIQAILAMAEKEEH